MNDNYMFIFGLLPLKYPTGFKGNRSFRKYNSTKDASQASFSMPNKTNRQTLLVSSAVSFPKRRIVKTFKKNLPKVFGKNSFQDTCHIENDIMHQT